MSSFETVSKRLTGLRAAQEKCIQTNLSTVAALETELNRIICENSQSQPPGGVHATKCGDSPPLATANKQLAAGFKDYHAHISKFAKELDKVLEDGSDGCRFESRFPENKRGPPMDTAIRHLVAQFLCHKALPAATRSLLLAGGDANNAHHPNAHLSLRSPEKLSAGAQTFLLEMPEVLHGLRSGEVKSAEAWMYNHRDQLGQLATFELSFEIARVRFLKLLEQPYSDEKLAKLLEFAEQYLSVFYDQYTDEIETLMSRLLTYGAAPVPSPTLTVPINQCLPDESLRPYLIRIKELVVNHCAKINDLPGDGSFSNLEILLQAGASANSVVATALKFVKTSDDSTESQHGANKRHKTLFDLEKSSLPVDFKTKPERRYHSVFCCPVSRQPASEGDPPVLLPCGHAILLSSMKSLPRRNNKFKCPTCYGPSEESNVIPLNI